MYLKYPLSTVDFFRTIDCCQGEVLLHTKENDILNLRSQLCRFVFAVALSQQSFFEGAYVTCTEQTDYALLQDYLTQ